MCEMIHTASLVHDDVIDTSDTRRGKPSVNVLWGQKKAILAGDFVLSRTAQLLAKIGSNDVNSFLSQVGFFFFTVFLVNSPNNLHNIILNRHRRAANSSAP